MSLFLNEASKKRLNMYTGSSGGPVSIDTLKSETLESYKLFTASENASLSTSSIVKSYS